MQITPPRIKLTEAEVMRAIQSYVERKHAVMNPEDFDYKVTIYWRAKYATVDVVRHIPVLTEAVSER